MTPFYGSEDCTAPTAPGSTRSGDVEFARDTFTAVMGPSGSGKSPLLQCCAGLDRPGARQVAERMTVLETEPAA